MNYMVRNGTATGGKKSLHGREIDIKRKQTHGNDQCMTHTRNK